jgi:predicted component of type VI protein secretion system
MIELVAERLLERTLDALVEDDPADRGEPVLRRVTQAVLREVVQRDLAAVV